MRLIKGIVIVKNFVTTFLLLVFGAIEIQAQVEPPSNWLRFENSSWYCEVDSSQGQNTIRKSLDDQGNTKVIIFEKQSKKLKKKIKRFSTKTKNLKKQLKSSNLSKKDRKRLKAKRNKLKNRKKTSRALKEFLARCARGELSLDDSVPDAPGDDDNDDSPGDGGDSDVDDVPAIPAGFAGIAGNGETTLSWEQLSNLNYTLYFSTAPGVTTETGTSIAGVSAGYNHIGLFNSVTYYYILTASNSVGESLPTAEISLTPQVAGATVYDPPWANATPLRTIDFNYDSNKSDLDNADDLMDLMKDLEAGDMLRIGPGNYQLSGKFDMGVSGTASNPIFIIAQTSVKPVFYRLSQSNNMMNITSSAEYLAFRGIDFNGGHSGIRIHRTNNIWIDDCEIHDVGEAALTANTHDTNQIYITRNHIYNTAGVGEGMYLGANNGAVIMSNSIIALNHVHDTTLASQGDGIELKQGSYGNWIVANVVHDTRYPGILVYGTYGQPINVIEGNIVYNSNDNTMQVQGEALVINNIVINGSNAFSSHSHQDTTVNLTVVHNTFINTGRAVKLSDWDNASGMIYANNVSYSRDGRALQFSGGSNGVQVSGNVVYGSTSGISSGFSVGDGISDFENLVWGSDITGLDLTPSPTGALVGAADSAYVSYAPTDHAQQARSSAPYEAGAFELDN